MNTERKHLTADTEQRKESGWKAGIVVGRRRPVTLRDHVVVYGSVGESNYLVLIEGQPLKRRLSKERDYKGQPASQRRDWWL